MLLIPNATIVVSKQQKVYFVPKSSNQKSLNYSLDFSSLATSSVGVPVILFDNESEQGFIIYNDLAVSFNQTTYSQLAGY